jgi:phage FluMu protein Com
MILGAEIGLIIFGIYALITGKLTLSKNRIVRGTAARLLAVIALLPLPLSLAVIFTVGMVVVSRGGTFDPSEGSARLKFSLIEAGIVVGCLIAVYAIGLPVAARQAARRALVEEMEDAEDADEWEAPTRSSQRRAERPMPPPVPSSTSPPSAPAAIRFRCAGCNSLIEVDAEYAGGKARCPKCKMVQEAPVIKASRTP